MIEGKCQVDDFDVEMRIARELVRMASALLRSRPDYGEALKEEAGVNPYLNTPPTELARKVKSEDDPEKKRQMEEALEAWRISVPGPFRGRSAKRWVDLGEWVIDFVSSRIRDGVKVGEIIKDGVAWGWGKGDVKREVRSLLDAGRLVEVKGRLFPSQDEYRRVEQRVFATRRRR